MQGSCIIDPTPPSTFTLFSPVALHTNESESENTSSAARQDPTAANPLNLHTCKRN